MLINHVRKLFKKKSDNRPEKREAEKENRIKEKESCTESRKRAIEKGVGKVARTLINVLMKTFVYILAGIVVAAVLGLVGIVLFAFNRKTNEENKSKTEAARAARWKKQDDESDAAERAVTELKQELNSN